LTIYVRGTNYTHDTTQQLMKETHDDTIL
jgi:hypothetical protein